MLNKLKVTLAISLFAFPQIALAEEDEAVSTPLRGESFYHLPLCNFQDAQQWKTLPINPFASQQISQGSYAIITVSMGNERFHQLHFGDVVEISGAQGFYYMTPADLNGWRATTAVASDGSSFQFRALASQRINDSRIGGGGSIRVRKVCGDW